MLRYVLLLLLLTFAVACGGSDDSGTSGSGGNAAVDEDGDDDDDAPVGLRQKYTPDKGTATVKGAIKFEGTVRNRKLDIAGDNYCKNCYKDGPPLKSESVMVGANGELANVFVYVKDGLKGWKIPRGSAVRNIDQIKCRYEPHVTGMQVGDTLKIKNGDEIMHNIHATDPARGDDWFNQGQPNKGDVHTEIAERAGFYPMKCDVHGWMSAFICVSKYPFFAVTGADGTFSLDKLPAGTYTIAAWHEKYDAQEQTVTVKDGETAEVSFTFKK